MQNSFPEQPHEKRQSLLEAVEGLRNVFEIEADEAELSGTLPASTVNAIYESGLFSFKTPRILGGAEADAMTQLDVIEAASRMDPAAGWCLMIGAGTLSNIGAFASDEAIREIFLDGKAPKTAGGAAASGEAIVGEGGYRGSGRWSFASGCRNATWMGAHCRVEEPDGSLRKHPDGRSLVLSLLFPVEQAKLIDTWDTIGLRGTASDSYELDDIFVPEAFTGTREHPDESREPGALYAFPQQASYAVGVAGVALGIARAMLEAFTELAAEKTPRGLSRMAENAGVQAGVAKCEARIGAARAYLLEMLNEITARAPRDRAIDIQDRARVRLATTNAIHGSIETADWLYKYAGGNASFPGSPYERRPTRRRRPHTSP